ncbi:MAG: acetyl/propionyl/methylcrotonyl-CoA carboxylase subunit alpha [Hyphomicrobiales bacterium]
MFSSILIANRGEIACRIERTARRLGLRTIAVYSEADARALHVRNADEAYLIGPPPARESYLNTKRILEIAVEARAECIHPGYGFLSENPDFAEACRNKGIVFVGPPPEAIRAMGHKDSAKHLMRKARVPVVPGYDGVDQDVRTLARAGDDVGYPVMIKAVAGGGGKGMRRVARSSEFLDALASCRREAAAAFGDDRVIIEKFIPDPRHVEVQIIADARGTCLHLLERDCSLQRRHQKVIEEAPASKLPRTIRESMCRAAVAAAKAVGYVGAGTVEFVAGTRSGGEVSDFYFLEMNTRLQVEHPVTEEILGLDLVEHQLRIAAGEDLALSQDEVRPRGHAIEARIYAENPASGFLPQTGRLHVLSWPRGEEGLRIDSGVEAGDEITSFYDPMIAKMIAHAETREAAIDKLGLALRQTAILGLTSNVGFLGKVLDHPLFRAGGATTAFIDAHLPDLAPQALTPEAKAEAASAWIEYGARPIEAGSGWGDTRGWSLAGLPRKDIRPMLINGDPVTVEVLYEAGGRTIAPRGLDGTVRSAAPSSGPSFFDEAARVLFTIVGQVHCTVRAEDLLAREAGPAEGATAIHAPMPGRVIAILVELDQTVEPGQPLLILDAMKMEHTLRAGVKGTVKRLPASPGTQVKEGDLLCLLEASE